MATGRQNSYTAPYGLPGLLFIEPTGAAEPPIDDELTRRITTALAHARTGLAYKGWHTCACGEESDVVDLIIYEKFVTNSLAAHYVACHRTEIPAAELADVEALSATETSDTRFDFDGKWSCSRFEEQWSGAAFYDTREEAIANAETMCRLKEGDVYFVGQAERVCVPDIDADDVLERAHLQVYDLVGEAAEDCFAPSEEDKKELEERLNRVWLEWVAEKKMDPTCFSIDHIEKRVHGMDNAAAMLWCQDWLESSGEWGTRPDGYTLHQKREDIDAFLKEELAREMQGKPPGYIPEECIRPWGDPREIEIKDPETIYKVKKSTYGVRGQGQEPPNGQ